MLSILDALLFLLLAYTGANYFFMLLGFFTYKPDRKPAGNPKVTVIIPTKDEEEVIEETLKRLRESYANLEIIVVDASRKDITRKIARKYTRKIMIDKLGKGKSYALNKAVDKATSEYIYFLDGDSRVTRTTIKELLYSIQGADASVGFLIPERSTKRSLVGKIHTTFLNAANYWASAVLGTAFVTGRNYMIRKKALIEVGKFGHVISEDMNLSLRLYEKKRRVVFNPKALCYETSPPKLYHFFKQQERWIMGTTEEIALAINRHTIIVITAVFVGLFYIFSPLFLILSLTSPYFLIPGLISLAAIIYLSLKYLDFKEIVMLPPALAVLIVIFSASFLSMLIKKILGIRIGWYKTPR